MIPFYLPFFHYGLLLLIQPISRNVFIDPLTFFYTVVSVCCWRSCEAFLIQQPLCMLLYASMWISIYIYHFYIWNYRDDSVYTNAHVHSSQSDFDDLSPPCVLILTPWDALSGDTPGVVRLHVDGCEYSFDDYYSPSQGVNPAVRDRLLWAICQPRTAVVFESMDSLLFIQRE